MLQVFFVSTNAINLSLNVDVVEQGYQWCFVCSHLLYFVSVRVFCDMETGILAKTNSYSSATQCNANTKIDCIFWCAYL